MCLVAPSQVVSLHGTFVISCCRTGRACASFAGSLAASMALPTSSGMPWPRAATVGTTGTPSHFSSLATSMSMPLRARHVHLVEADHHRHVHFHELESEEEIAFQHGSADDVDDDVRLFPGDVVPGDHLFQGKGGQGIDAGQVDDGDIVTVEVQAASALSTVLPGQLPMVWCEPVSWLKMTLLPTLALPARAMFRCFAIAVLSFPAVMASGRQYVSQINRPPSVCRLLFDEDVAGDFIAQGQLRTAARLSPPAPERGDPADT